MGILIRKTRIQNFRSIESIDIELGMTNLLIGQNNTGKSNFLRAINIPRMVLALFDKLSLMLGVERAKQIAQTEEQG